MIHLHEGQCGLCVHFGEHHAASPHLYQIQREQKAPDEYLDECGHPQHSGLHLRVTATSGCDGFSLVDGHDDNAKA